tara:strand:- start:1420 stop:1704 length:285 start_codon:yes stop_codon:yes gene_type:complete
MDFRRTYMRGRTGNLIKSQEIRHYPDGRTAFFSYNSKIAEVNEDCEVTLFNPFWNMYSQTTNKYLIRFLHNRYYVTNSIKDIRKRVISGEYLVA